MRGIMDRRQEIYDYFQVNAMCQKYFLLPENGGHLAAYYNSMYLLQDSTESLWQHRSKGFADDPLQAYIEFWGIMQAIIIQQDSIGQLYETITGISLKEKVKKLPSWMAIRELRNTCAGHPTISNEHSKTNPVTRTFMGRGFGSYDEITYEQWQEGIGTTHPTVDLGALIDAYAGEAEALLVDLFNELKRKWP